MLESRFQSFADIGGPSNGAARVAELRKALETTGLTGFIVPRADEHQNEYVPPGAERLLWLTGFSGSAGIAIVLKDKAALFVDGRYTEQAKSQADRSVFQLRHVVDEPPVDWISQNMGPGEKLGYDPRLHTPDAVSRFSAACRKAGAELVALPANPIDAIWRDRPQPPLGMVSQQRGRFAGESAAAKIERARGALKGGDGLLISDPHNLAWLFNIRGADVAHTPLPLGFAYLPANGRPTIFLDARKLTPAVSDEMAQLAELREPDALVGFVEQLGKLGSRVSFDASTAPALLTQTLERAGGKA
ncbi:aminopeptidase P family N-terminal domain-containing protein, partial [Roseiarcus sp.]|uniref:aminopeptidase P family N-terminal domain-containing protein n=1 Tax=Roseiarcus sp. TaxID=1969460 RepID=UPI003C437CB4